jgi:hypothetical protein
VLTEDGQPSSRPTRLAALEAEEGVTGIGAYGQRSQGRGAGRERASRSAICEACVRLDDFVSWCALCHRLLAVRGVTSGSVNVFCSLSFFFRLVIRVLSGENRGWLLRCRLALAWCWESPNRVKVLLRQDRRIVSGSANKIPGLSPQHQHPLQPALPFYRKSSLIHRLSFFAESSLQPRFAAADGDTAPQQLHQALPSFLLIHHHSTLLWQRASPLPLIFLSSSAIAAPGPHSNLILVVIAVSPHRPFPQNFSRPYSAISHRALSFI